MNMVFSPTCTLAFCLSRTHTQHTALLSTLLQLDWIRHLLFSAKLLSHLPFTRWPCPSSVPVGQFTPWSTPQRSSLPPFNKPRALSMRSSARDSAPMTSSAAGGAVRSSVLDSHTMERGEQIHKEQKEDLTESNRKMCRVAAQYQKTKIMDQGHENMSNIFWWSGGSCGATVGIVT